VFANTLAKYGIVVAKANDSLVYAANVAKKYCRNEMNGEACCNHKTNCSGSTWL
jgi:hypothetical protein